MLRVTVEIVPFGLEGHKRTLHTMEIYNIGNKGVTFTKTGDPRYSYGVRTKKEDEEDFTEHGVLVKRFDRKRPFIDLINIILKKFNSKGDL